MPDETNNNQQTNEDGKGAGTQQTQADSAGEQPGSDESKPLDWDSWYQELPDETRGMVEDHLSGLKSALDSERSERRKLSSQIKDLSEKAEKGSEVQQELEKLNGSLEQANLRADFFESAATSDVANARLAWIAARDEGLFEEYTNKRTGRTDFERVFEALKDNYPELFKISKQQSTNAHAGAGTRSPGGKVKTMNDLIRERAGIRT